MRLTEQQKRSIHDTAEEMFGAEARVYLFGSRADDRQRGGDIDLLVEVDHVLDNRPSAAARFAARLQRRLGDRKIDVLVVDPRTDRQAIHKVAHEGASGEGGGSD
jgi:predicted nucleotidyltransferase